MVQKQTNFIVQTHLYIYFLYFYELFLKKVIIIKTNIVL